MPFHQTSSYPSVGSSASASLSIFDPELTRKISNLQEIFLEQKSKIDELDDPLSIFDSYHAQLAQLLQFYSNHPDTTKFITSILVPVLDSATQTFARDPRYRNDPRYLKLWLSYAKYCREAEDIFVFLSQEGIAQELANFYEEYALLLTGKNPKQA
jgi:checkpoint serine/threonine-protein kinase